MKGRTHRKRSKKRQQTRSFTDDLHTFQKLYSWMRRNGFIMKRMKPAIFNDTGRGMKAFEEIKAGDLLISVPLNNLITCDAVMKTYLQDALLTYYLHLSAMEILSIFLMCEKLQDASSEWNPYINCLPSQYILPTYFPQESLQFLPSIIEPDVKEQLTIVEKTYNKLKLLLNDIEKTFPQFHGFLTFKLFKWAWASVNTRCVYMKCEKAYCDNFYCKNHLALAPLLDFLNHSPNVQVTAGFNRETNCYEIVHHNNIRKYEQVFINYGPHGNCKLFLEYGFIVPNNVDDCILFNWDSILKAFTLLNTLENDNCIKEKVKFLNDFNLIRNIGCESGGLTWNFEIILKVMASKKCKRKQLLTFFSDMNNLDAEESKIYRRLLHHLLNLKIQEFSTVSFDSKKMKELTQFSLDCVNLIKQLCYENRKLLLKCLTFVA